MARRDRMRVFSVSFPPGLLGDLERAAAGRPGGRSEVLREAFVAWRDARNRAPGSPGGPRRNPL